MPVAKRIIPCLDVDKVRVVKGINFKNIVDAGDPVSIARRYEEEGADEIVYIDNVASLYSRDGIFELLRETVKEVFIPITVGGGIRSIEDAYKYFMNGADKIFINAMGEVHLAGLRMQIPFIRGLLDTLYIAHSV